MVYNSIRILTAGRKSGKIGRGLLHRGEKMPVWLVWVVLVFSVLHGICMCVYGDGKEPVEVKDWSKDIWDSISRE